MAHLTAAALDTRVPLNDGHRIPLLGLGVYQTPPGNVAYNAVSAALRSGYRHIDSAALYGNEEDVGRAVRESGIPRNEIFLTTKLWVKGFKPQASQGKNEGEDEGEYQYAMDQAKKSLENLGTYIDLYLMHSPHHPQHRMGMWRALEDLKGTPMPATAATTTTPTTTTATTATATATAETETQEKATGTGTVVRSIGVSNYGVHHLKELLAKGRVPPAVNQVEIHPFLLRDEIAAFCQSKGIWVEAYSPLAKAERSDDATLAALAADHGKAWAQVMIRWSLQKGYICIPKSVNEGRIAANADVFGDGFELSEKEMTRLNGLDLHLTTGWDPTEAE